MKTAKEELNRVFWDRKENPKDYEIYYYDRVLKKELSMPFARIKKIEGAFMELKDDVSIPTHRVTKIKKKGKLIWERRRR